MIPTNNSLSPLPVTQSDSTEESPESRLMASRSGSRAPKEKHRVRFTLGGDTLDSSNNQAPFESRDENRVPIQRLSAPTSLPDAESASSQQESSVHKRARSFPSPRENDQNPLKTVDSVVTNTKHAVPTLPLNASEDDDPRVRMARDSQPTSNWEDPEPAKHTNNIEEYEADEPVLSKMVPQNQAQERSQRLSRTIGTYSEPVSRRASPIGAPAATPPASPPPEDNIPDDLEGIPLTSVGGGTQDNTGEENEEGRSSQHLGSRSRRWPKSFARSLRNQLGLRQATSDRRNDSSTSQSGQTTPPYERDPHHYVPRPQQYRPGYLSSLMRFFNQQVEESHVITNNDRPGSSDGIQAESVRHPPRALLSPHVTTPSDVNTPSISPQGSPTASGSNTPKTNHQKWYYKNRTNASTASIAGLIGSFTGLAQTFGSQERTPGLNPKDKGKSRSSQMNDALFGKGGLFARAEGSCETGEDLKENVQRQTFIVEMCRALMTYGAPTHRLEEGMTMSARVLQINAQFLYIPGCMIISFDDPGVHTTEVKIIRVTQIVDLGKLRDAYEIYKEVVHDTICVDEALRRLEKIVKQKNPFGPWLLVLMYGLASMCVGPFAFEARAIDLPIAFLLGGLLGFMQLILAPRSDLYANIFEISAAVLTSFLARAFGSIRHGNLFCFSALAQSAIALILPGYTVLCSSLELQSRHIVAGSVRMVYAIIYSLFLGFGITIGTSFYGAADKHATSATTCQGGPGPFWWQMVFVPPFTFCLIIINQGRMRHMPEMIIIALVGWFVNYFSVQRFSSNAQIANTLTALAIGVLGNLYSRLRRGMAATALLPAIFVQVPSGLAASGSLVSGITSANQIVGNFNNGLTKGVTTVSNGTQASLSSIDVNNTVLDVGYSMIQVAIGITVGLFLSALVVYPFGKKRSGLFSF